MMHELCNTLSISMQNIIENQSLNNENIPAIWRIEQKVNIFYCLLFTFSESKALLQNFSTCKQGG